MLSRSPIIDRDGSGPASRAPATSLIAMISSLSRNHDLVWQLTKREVSAKYQGSFFGLTWSFVVPVLMLCIYTFVFSVAFKARWGNGVGEENRTEFAIILFVGLIIHGFFSECLNRAPSLVLSNATYVKKVLFPLDVLPWIALGAALFHTAISLLVLLVAKQILTHSIPWTAIYLPLIILPLILGTLGAMWIASSLGVYVRDIGQLIGLITTVLLFLSPVFYPVSALPERYQFVIQLNPLTFFIEQSRSALIWGQSPDWMTLAAYFAGSLLVAWVGFWWFQKTRDGFADVI